MLENRIRKLLLQAGVDPSLTGYEYLRMAVKLCYEDKSHLRYVTKQLYWDIAKEFDVKPSSVERCMRFAIESMKKTEGGWFRKEVVGLLENKRELTNSQFLAVCVEILMMQEAEDVK